MGARRIVLARFESGSPGFTIEIGSLAGTPPDLPAGCRRQSGALPEEADVPHVEGVMFGYGTTDRGLDHCGLRGNVSKALDGDDQRLPRRHVHGEG